MSCGTSLAEASNRDGARALAREPDGPAAPEPARPGRSGCLRTGRARPSRAGAPASPRSRDLRGVFLCESRRRRALRQATPTRAPHWIPARCPPTDPEPSREPRRPSPSTHGPSPLERAPGLSPGRLRHVDLRLGPGHGGPPPALFGPRRLPPQGGPPRPHRRRRPAGRTRGAGNVDGSPLRRRFRPAAGENRLRGRSGVRPVRIGRRPRWQCRPRRFPPSTTSSPSRLTPAPPASSPPRRASSSTT